MSIPVIQGNQGKLNKDLEPAYVTQGDYLDAENVRYFTTDGQSDGSHENVIGNSFAFDIGDVDPSKKGYKVCFASLGAQSNTGWNYFGTPKSSSISSQQSYDPHIIEDVLVPGDLWMCTGFNIWKYNSALNTWTEMTSMLIDTGISFKSARITQSPTGVLTCIYLKNFGKGDRYVVKKWNSVTSSWDWLVNNLTGFELSDGYIDGNNPSRPYGAYYGQQIKYSASGDLYMYVTGVSYNLAYPIGNPYRSNLLVPKVFKYNTVLLKWDFISGPTASWIGGYQSGFSLNATYGASGRLGVITGNIIESGGYLHFPLVCCGSDPNAFYPYVLDPIISRYNIATNTWDRIMAAANVFYPGGIRMGTTVAPSANNITSWAEPTISIDSLGKIHFCFGFRYFSVGWVIVFKQGAAPNIWSAIINPSTPIINSTNKYYDGKVSMVIDSSDDIILTYADNNQGGRLVCVKYDTSSGAISLYDNTNISITAINGKENDLLLTSTGSLYVSYSDYTYAANYSNFVGVPSIQKYFSGGGATPQNFTFTYSNGLTIGSITGATTISDITTGINSIFPPSKYNVILNNVVEPDGTQCLEFYITPLDYLGNPIVGGFNYYVTTTQSVFSLTTISDPIPLAESGSLNVIGSYNLLNDLFVISTQNNRPVISDNLYAVNSFYVTANLGLVLVIQKGSDIIDNSIVSLSNDVSSQNYSGEHFCTFDNTSSPSFDYITLNGYYPSAAGAAPQSLFVKSISRGSGEIGVAIKNENLSEQLPPSSPWTYKRLLRYYALSLSTLKQVDMIAETNNRGVSIYWVDNYNVPRSFYYYGPYIQDGAWNDINQINTYTRESILDQLKLQKSYAGTIIDYVGQGSGRLLCGNYRYSVRFTTSENVSTSWSPLSNPFSVYPVQADPYRIYGGDSAEDSGKSNIINISWTQSDSYEYIEIAYTRTIPGGGSSPSSLFSLEQIIARKIRIPNGTNSIQYEHSGDEINVNNIPDGDLSSIPFIIRRAKNIRSLDNRLVLSNVRVGNNESYLVDIFDSLTYSLKKKAMPISGSYNPGPTLQKPFSSPFDDVYVNKSLSFGEYMDPRNIFYFTGYMQNETYRFYGVAEFLSGELSDAYFLFDVKFDRRGNNALDPKRNVGLNDFNLNDPPGFIPTSATSGNVYIPYLEINMPSSLPSINGAPASSIIRRIHIYRENVNNRTVLASGIGILGNSSGPDNGPSSDIGVVWAGQVTGLLSRISYIQGIGQGQGSVFNVVTGSINASSVKYAPFPMFVPELAGPNQSYQNAQRRSNAIQWYDFPVSTPSSVYSAGSVTSPNLRREMITFYSPDFSLTNYRIDSPSVSSDTILNYGHYDNYFASYPSTSASVNYHSFGSYYVNRYSGDPEVLPLNTNITDGPVYWVGEGGQQKINYPSLYTGYKTYTKQFGWIHNGVGAGLTSGGVSMPEGYLFFTSGSGVSPIGCNPAAAAHRQKDYGTYYMSYFRSLTPDQQYGDSDIGTPVPTGAYYDLQTNTTQLGTPSSPNTIDVFGGDTYTCKTLLKIRYYPTANTGNNASGFWGCGIEYYGQSFVNPYLRHNPNPATASSTAGYIWPNEASDPVDDPATIQEWFINGTEKITYNPSYSDKNVINQTSVYNKNIYYDNLLPATIFYSEPKLQEAITDSYSYIKATNRKDLDISSGPINHHEIINGELYTFQEKAFQKQYFNTTAMFADATSQIIMGDGGAVLPRKGLIISTHGLINKWSVIKGHSPGGNDVIYWFDAINKKIIRFGADGVVPISSRGNIDSFLANNTNYAQLHDTPANDMGVHGIWDESNKEVIWTFRLRKEGIDYDTVNGPITGYPFNDVVYYNDNIANENYEWHQTGEFWVSQDDDNVALPSQIPPGPGVPPYWIHVPHTNSKYYNEFTICYSETKNGFTTFYSFKPKIYLQYKDRYLSPRPISPQGYVYEHNFGERCIWYTGSNHFNPILDPTALKKEAFIEGIVNYNPEIVKTAEAVTIDAYTAPYLVEVRTQDHNTYMDAASFTLAETMYRSPVKNDTIGGTVVPDGDTSRPYGRWIALKYIMQYGYKQAIRTFVMKVRQRSRLYNR